MMNDDAQYRRGRREAYAQVVKDLEALHIGRDRDSWNKVRHDLSRIVERYRAISAGFDGAGIPTQKTGLT